MSSPTSVTQSSTSGGGAPQVTSFDAQGGKVEVNYTDSSMSLGVVSPSPGWSIANTQSDGESIQVRFAQESGGDPVDVDVHLDGGKPVADTADTAPAQTCRLRRGASETSPRRVDAPAFPPGRG